MSNKADNKAESKKESASKSSKTLSNVPTSQQSISKPSQSSVRIKNISRNRIIELDFGRDQEVRIAPGAEASISKKLLDHPAYKKEQASLSVLK